MPHSDHSPSPPPSSLPPFPTNIPTAPLLRISLTKLLSHDATEQSRCFAACQSLGFFYLSLDGPSGSALESASTSLFELMPTFFNLPLEEKESFDYKDRGSYFGYKGFGKGVVDASGKRDGNEFFNTSKDEVLNIPTNERGEGERLPMPECLLGSETERGLFKEFIEQSHAFCDTILHLLQDRLPLKEEVKKTGGLQSRHRLSGVSGDQVRFVKAPPMVQGTEGVSLGEHTDFGSVTVLFNKLGGLQVRLPEGMDPIPPSTDSSPMSEIERQLCKDGWCYVRPLQGHCIINLGDALVKFSSGTLRSNIHRVVAPPGDQNSVVRWSLVYFCRPEDEVVLGSLVEGAEEEEEGGVTAKEWILRRALGRRDPKGWERSMGTEEGSMRKGGMRV